MAGYVEPGPSRDEVDALAGPAVVQFGTDWCGFCQAAEPFVQEALSTAGDIQHVKVEDGPGRPLGRSYRVKLWPTLVFLRDGKELARVVRPASAEEVRRGLEQIVGG